MLNYVVILIDSIYLKNRFNGAQLDIETSRLLSEVTEGQNTIEPVARLTESIEAMTVETKNNEDQSKQNESNDLMAPNGESSNGKNLDKILITRHSRIYSLNN